MPADVHEELNEYFIDKFGWAARSEGLFTTGSIQFAKIYGTVFQIYPADDYQFLWSPAIQDLYMEFVQEVNLDEGEDEDLAITDFCLDAVSSYKDNNLVRAMKSGREIMLQCEEYAAVAVGI
jgi:hypothetical protein